VTSELVIRSILLGIGLAMDAFSVSLADGLAEPEMKGKRMAAVAGTFGTFQFAMPLIGWVLVRTAVDRFNSLERYIPWIALILLVYIGGKMLIEGIGESRKGRERDTSEAASSAGSVADKGGPEQTEAKKFASAGDLVIQGIATSIDALSVGFTIEEYGVVTAVSSAVIIGIVTFAICIGGLNIGKKAGMALSGRASIAGGIILIAIGLEIWIKGMFF